MTDLPRLDRLVNLRPYAYHTCNLVNFESIRRSGALLSPEALLAGTEYERLLGERRPRSIMLTLDQGTVEIRDNTPLRLGSLALEDCTLEQFLRLLNGRVFLWPGTETWIISPGRGHFARYQSEGPVRMIRVPLTDLVEANPDRELEVTYCNSGSARHQQGRPVTRGPSTFQPISCTQGRMADVKELTFVGSANLPPSAQWAESIEGPWSPLVA